MIVTTQSVPEHLIAGVWSAASQSYTNRYIIFFPTPRFLWTVNHALANLRSRLWASTSNSILV